MHMIASGRLGLLGTWPTWLREDYHDGLLPAALECDALAAL
jgi:hypothetical protein